MALTDSAPALARPAGFHRPGGALDAAFASLASSRKGLAIAALLYWLAVLLPLGTNVAGIFLNGVRLVLLVTIVPMTFRLLMGRYGKVHAVDILFLLHVVWMTVALAVNNPDQVIANAGSTGIEFIGGYVLGRACIRTREDFLALIRLLATAALCLFPFVIYEVLTGNAIILNTLHSLPGLSSLRDISIGKRLGFDRAQLVFAHPIHSGLFFSMLLPLVFVGMTNIWSDTRRVMTALVVMLSGFFALSSGALLAILLQLFLVGWAWALRKTDRRWLILIGLCCLAYVVIDLLSNRSPIRVFMTYATFSAHTAFWRSIIFDWGLANVIGDAERGITGSPIFGLGLNDWIRPSYMRSGSVDNFWLLNAMRYGLPGFFLLAGGYATILWTIMRRDLSADPVLWQFRRAWVFAFIGLSLTLVTVHVWHTIYSVVFFMFGAGVWLATAEPQSREGTAPPPADAETGGVSPYSRFAQVHRRAGVSPASPGRSGWPKPDENAGPGRHRQAGAPGRPAAPRMPPG